MTDAKQHLMVIGGHIGDAENTGGLVAAKYARGGHRVTLLHMTGGEKGNPAVDHKTYRKQRVEEAHAFSDTIGANECIILDHPDAELHVNDSTIHQMCDLIRRLRPDIILTHWRGSFHRDHRNTYTIVMEGGFLAALPGIEREHPAHLIRGLYFCENWEDKEDYEPDLWIDVSEVFDTWVKACEHSRLLRGEISYAYLQHYKGLSAMRGAEVGVEHAVTVSLPPISRKRKVDWFPIDTEPVLIF